MPIPSVLVSNFKVSSWMIARCQVALVEVTSGLYGLIICEGLRNGNWHYVSPAAGTLSALIAKTLNSSFTLDAFQTQTTVSITETDRTGSPPMFHIRFARSMRLDAAFKEVMDSFPIEGNQDQVVDAITAPLLLQCPCWFSARRQASSAGIESASSAKMRPASASGSARASGVRPTKVTPTATPATFALPLAPVRLYVPVRLHLSTPSIQNPSTNRGRGHRGRYRQRHRGRHRDGKKRLATPQPARKRRLPSVDEETVPASDNEECVPDVASSSRVPAKARARSLSGASSLTSLQSTPPPSLRSTPVRKRWGEGNDFNGSLIKRNVSTRASPDRRTSARVHVHRDRLVRRRRAEHILEPPPDSTLEAHPALAACTVTP
ncbi:hypothetical protein C8Q74DRAFT_1364197 [Fomes fomentarius]|nr:hypothetical protein C8Q74DRAFT_1364197 [Fomes fomentarius]